jgi:hypothetical protein
MFWLPIPFLGSSGCRILMCTLNFIELFIQNCNVEYLVTVQAENNVGTVHVQFFVHETTINKDTPLHPPPKKKGQRAGSRWRKNGDFCTYLYQSYQEIKTSLASQLDVWLLVLLKETKNNVACHSCETFSGSNKLLLVNTLWKVQPFKLVTKNVCTVAAKNFLYLVPCTYFSILFTCLGGRSNFFKILIKIWCTLLYARTV